ncbi:ARM repeat-containing protein [Sistotremastrum suecicum HHB10207 ss-3]|uniref:ARM repeat-containing protein n=1 Tax=Sistotremastrum suecicum HHB10207 ss-3 TaxID=1314776 RepID=A0A165Y444_9AGAM|nr:ARM repeat-containing protein [Sistotremastrum suecicum HHB10207 ss-3]
MDLLRTLGSAAASSLLQKSGITFPFQIGEKIPEFEANNIWTLHDGIKKDDSTPISIFTFEGNTPQKKNLLPLAKNALRKLRTLRHPDVLKFIDAVETDNTIYIATERITPFSVAVQSMSNKSSKETEEWLVWGLQRISTALAFINESASSTHGSLRVESVFVSQSGEWKLGGFEVLSNAKDDLSVLYTMGGLMPNANSSACPEVRKSGWSSLKEGAPASADAYSLGLLLYSMFNPTFPPPATLEPPHPPPTQSSAGSIPSYLYPSYKKLLHPSPKPRMTPGQFLDLGMGKVPCDHPGFFINNKLVKICAELDNFALASESDKAALLKALKENASSFPTSFATRRILPSIITALEYGGPSAPLIFPLVLQLGKSLSPSDYTSTIITPILKLFALPDRGVRMALLDALPEYADKLDNKAVADKIWPHLQTGFTDTVAVIREATVKSIGLVSSKLSDRILNNELLRHLAKMQLDPEASIRTNTCILIGRLAPTLGYNTKRKVLVPAFARAVKDTFVHARVAGLMSFMATVECYEIDELATKVLPIVVTALVDKEKLVRDQAFKAVELFMKKLEAHAAQMPATELVDEAQPGVQGSNIPNQSTLVNSAAGAAGALAGWAMSSISKKITTGDMQPNLALPGGIDRPTSAPPPPAGTTQAPPTIPIASPSLSTFSTFDPGNHAHAKGKAMQLGASKTSSNAAQSSLAAASAWADEIVASTGADAWDGDLMDVNADADDWSAFETAPVPAAPVPVVAPKAVVSAAAGASDDEGWGDFESKPTVTPAVAPHRPAHPPSRPAIKRVASPTPTKRTASPAPSQPATPHVETSPAPSLSTMTPEEKAAEMARRKEERKLVRSSFCNMTRGPLLTFVPEDCPAEREESRKGVAKGGTPQS